MALQSCLFAVAALLASGVTARPQRIAVFEPINFNNETDALLPPSATESKFNMETRGACSSGPVYAPICSDTFPLITLEADSVVQFIVPGSPLKLAPFVNCGWEFQGPPDGNLYISCETASFYFGQYFLVWENDGVSGVHNQQNVEIKYQFRGSSGRVGVRTFSKSFYASISCEVTFIAGPGATVATPAGTDAPPATTEGATQETTVAPGTTAAPGSTVVPGTTVFPGTTPAPGTPPAPGTTPAPATTVASGTTVAPGTTSAPATTSVSGSAIP